MLSNKAGNKPEVKERINEKKQKSRRRYEKIGLRGCLHVDFCTRIVWSWSIDLSFAWTRLITGNETAAERSPFLFFSPGQAF
ncbi:MAG TPA: hypothetical protein ENJ87_12930 [Gammaproteobacteria bacterium]|nr:hypothetical protein [Gammaproteobacteria bacterium]